MKILIIFSTIFLFSASVFSQPDPKRVPPHSRPKPPIAAETLPETEDVPLDATAAPCQLTVKDALPIGGVKLTLTPDELGKALKIKINPGAPNDAGISTFQIDEKNKSALPNGINLIKLNFYDSRLFFAQFFFDNDAPKKTLNDFAAALSKKYNFSNAWFKTAHRVGVAEPRMEVEERYAYLFCPGELRFTITTAESDGFKLEILDLKTNAQIAEKQRQNKNSNSQ